ncbi:PrsW family intramembrane metalloprotease [Paenibacillus motobuensis]|uniref:PrsW family glutamic-type intramembrane protease n=1 Tax=Paenibacillus TaxID=44249 RepID=UPI002041DDAC|nr:MULTISPECIES: PrsW family glutamic-type intramembrane protease [Paenibacillus]MCM3039493.1 PrsW family intramembrane metalloprotease [Paenibacillus lutimineralis]MCM3646597.1 PrsW family intramembrane metalloprotease [Paenibacillus motobuensis]
MIWSIRTGIRDFLEGIIRICRSWIERFPLIRTAYTIFSWISLIAFVLSLFFVKESRTMLVQYLWSFYVLLQFWVLCRSKTMPWKLIVPFVLAGVFLVVPFTTLTVNSFHLIFNGRTSDTWSVAVVTPIFEELWKLLPLAVFLLFSRRASALSLSDYTLIGAATGVGFQLMEELTRRWLNPGKFGYSYTMLGGKTIHWDLFSLFPGRFEESMFPTVMTVGHPVHTAMIALAFGIAYRLRTRLTKWIFLFPAIILLWSILDHAAYNGQYQLPGWVLKLHDWTGSGYKTQPVFLLMLAVSLVADYWTLNKIRKRLPELPNEPFFNPFTELWNMSRSFFVERGKYMYWLGFYRERRELGFVMLYGNNEAVIRREPIDARVKALYRVLTGLALILLGVGLFASIGAYTGGGEASCFACMFDSLQNWWDRLDGYQQGAILLGALALSLLFVGFWPAFGIVMTGWGIAGSGHEIAGYIRDPKKLLTPENALSVAIGIVLSRIPFGRVLKWAGQKARHYGRKLLDKLGSRKPGVSAPEPKLPRLSKAELDKIRESAPDYYKDLMDNYGDQGHYFHRTVDDYEDLAKDPAKNFKINEKSKIERQAGLELEARGELPGPISRDLNPAGAEFIDANGVKWDVKGWHSKYAPRGYSLEKAISDIEKSLSTGENVIIDTTKMYPEHIEEVRVQLNKLGLSDKVLWWP